MNRFIHYASMFLPTAMFSVVAAAPACAGEKYDTKEELNAIHALLDTYTQSVSDRDQQKFEALLLDQHIPFVNTGKLEQAAFVATTQSIADYASFKSVIFESDRRFSQTFKYVKVEQEGNLAQVSLRYVTRDVASGKGGEGWKVLQLLKVNGHWKIASEFFR